MAVSLAVVLPVLLATMATLVFAVLDASGTTPFSKGPPRNIAEAAGAGLASEVLRFLAAGEDPIRVWPLRAEIISSTVTRATVLEAAVWSGKGPLVRLLDERGVIVDQQTRRHLACLASDIGAREIVDYLAVADPACVPGETADAIVARSKAQR